MAVRTVVKVSEYHDSVSLMLVARDLAEMQGVNDAAVVMGTGANKAILADAGLLTKEAEAAGTNDLVIAVSAESSALAEAALEEVETLLKKKAAAEETGEFRPKTLRGAVSSHPEANVAVISVAGRYAADEAWEALRRGLHVLLFSDNVSLEDEIALKRYARERGLLLMGPGAGTTLLNGAALGFANVIPPGVIGVVSAAGTGLQEVTSLIARHGAGVTQGLGVGGRDLSQEVGGIMMLESLKALQEDPATEVILLVSKPPAHEVVEVVLKQVAASKKATVVCFMGGDMRHVEKVKNAVPARTLQEGALLAAQAAGADMPDIKKMLAEETKRLQAEAKRLCAGLKEGQKYLRGLFSGGTLCYEAQVIWKEMLAAPAYSNAPLPGAPKLADSTKSQEHTAVDLGEEEFTVGRPHPMIDHDLRVRRLLGEAGDPETAAVMLDVVLGYGAHPDPASELGPAVEEARRLGRDGGRELVVVASVTGTQGDPQGLDQTVSTLEARGAVVCDSNAAAARLAAMLVSG